MVIWIIGLSGSGKTYLSKKILSKINGKKILVDGDMVRKYITYNLKYSLNDRRKNSILIADLCEFLESQGFTVICSVLSIFPKHQKLNRTKFNNYFQIYIKSEFSKLKERDNKKVYSNNNNVVGKNIKFPTPYKSDLIIENNFKLYSQKKIDRIIKKISNVRVNKKKS